MRLYAFEVGGVRRIGAEHAGQLVDLAAAQSAVASDEPGYEGTFAIPAALMSFVRGGEATLTAARDILTRVSDLVGRGQAYVFRWILFTSSSRSNNPERSWCPGRATAATSIHRLPCQIFHHSS